MGLLRSMAKRNFFGTDGIRGKVGQAPITPDFVLQLAHAVGRVLRQTEAHPVVLIGKDTRISGYMLESALESGFNSAGVDVVLLGPVPTPAVAYLTRAQRASLGVVISASHNPFDDNGIKFFSAMGAKLPDEWELAVEAAMAQAPQWADSAQLGRTRRLNDAAGRYIEFCKSTFEARLSLKGLKVVIDAAHGAAYHIAPDVLHELGAEVISIGCAPDGLNINQGVGATHPEALVAAVLQHGADLGIALDGDADRLQMVDAKGRLYNGDELIYLLAQDRVRRGQPVPGVVGTLMTNMAVELAVRAQGMGFVRAKVGDRYVLEALAENGWTIGGEGSGHILVLDKHSTGDGVIAALQVLQAVVRSGQSLAQLLGGLTLFPQTMINVRVQPGTDWKQNQALQDGIASAEARLQGRGRVLIRASGTEPLLRVMVEADDAALAEGLAKELAALV
jgi:phosphoglucosamine mutase